MLIDLHNDAIPRLIMDGHADLSVRNSRGATDLVRLREGGVQAQTFVMFCDGRYRGAQAHAYAMAMMDRFDQLMDRAPQLVKQAHRAAEIPAIVATGKIAALLAVEGGHMIADSLENLETFCQRGMVYLTLTWNNSTAWATSARDEVMGNIPRDKKGLSALGVDIVTRMNELGAVADLSHAGEQTFYDVIRTTRKPVMASHSNAYSLAPHYRNLKDEQLAALRENSGLVGINFYAGFVDTAYHTRFAALIQAHQDLADSLGSERLRQGNVDARTAFLEALPPNETQNLLPDLDRLIDHVDHIVAIAGIDHVGIGSDFDGAEAYPKGLHDVTAYPILLARLKARGYTAEMLAKLTGTNTLRVLSGKSHLIDEQ
ncbi:membrane dipeptidase [Parapedobacter luteus]|uniref:Membrane dipeptidase n=2 Tax=Parapedobacter luteus TaxID=623280 RepID=A0A1T5CV39_9SPHI|nr:membrane dipeptidase [Parapedobacter luteus]